MKDLAAVIQILFQEIDKLTYHSWNIALKSKTA